MALIDEIVQVNVTKANLPVTSVGFDSLLIIGSSKKENRVKEYTNLSEALEDYEETTAEYKAAALALGQSTKLNKILIGQVMTEEETLVQAYTAITNENNDFYGVIAPSIAGTENADIIALAEAIETEDKLFGTSSKEEATLQAMDTTSLLYQLAQKNLDRTYCIYHSKAGHEDGVYPEAAWFGLQLSKDAGSSTWAYKTLSGFAADKLSSADRGQLQAKKGNYFVSMSGRDIMLDGRVVSGEHIDIIQGVDWLSSTIKTNIANVLLLNDKVPYTNPGIAIIESMVRNSLNAAVDRDIIDRETIKVTVPDVRNISTSDKQARILPDVKFEATLAGAIHKVAIQGTVSI